MVVLLEFCFFHVYIIWNLSNQQTQTQLDHLFKQGKTII